MSRLHTWVRALLHRGAYEQDMDAEMRFHLEAYAETLQRENPTLTRDEALRRARLNFGTYERTKEECRDAQGVSMFENLMQDLRFAFRTMRRSPGFTAVAILSLGLGIGANTAIFTLINTLMLKSLPVRAPQSLVSFGKQTDAGIVAGISGSIDIFPYEFYQEIQQHNDAFDGVTAYGSFTTSATIRRSGATNAAPTMAMTHLVAGNFFDVLGAKTILGRPLSPDDDRGPASRPVAVISYHYWQHYFSGAPDVIGQSVIVNNTPVTVVGVTAPNFFGVTLDERPPEMWLPLGLQPQVFLSDSLLGPNGLFWLHIMARDKAGVPRTRAQEWVSLQLRQYMMSHGGADLSAEDKTAISQSYVELKSGAAGVSRLRNDYERPLQILMAVVVVVLLIACANLANFLLAKTASREHEISTRLALGAGRGRIVRQMLTEALLISFCGGALGLVLAYWSTGALITFVASGKSYTPFSAAPDWRVLAFSLGVSTLTGILFGVGPALRVSRLATQSGMKSSARSVTGDTSGSRLSRLVPKILVGVQVCLSLVLLVGAGLFLRTLRNLENQNFGFNPTNLLVANIEPKIAGYSESQLAAFHQRVTERISALPGVQSSAISGMPPMSGGSWTCPVIVKGRVVKSDDDNMGTLNRVSPRFFETIQLPLQQGRVIDTRDVPGAPQSVVFSEALAKTLFPKGDAIGQLVTFGDPAVKGDWEIVGIVRDAKYDGPRDSARRMVYLPVAQLTGQNAYAYWIEIRSSGNPTQMANAVRSALAEVDPNLPVPEIQTMNEVIDDFASRETLISRLSVFFALLALLLVCIGLYGVMTYSVVRRTNEIGIRMALGAQQESVLWMILRESLAVLAIGLAIGIPATVAAMRLVQSGLFGLTPSDPLTFSVSVSVVVAVTLFSAYLPARRATKVDPMVALRYE